MNAGELSPRLLRLGSWLVRHRIAVLGLVVAAAGALLPVATRLRAGFSIDSFFRSSDPELQRARAHYGRDFQVPANLLLFCWDEPDPFGGAALERLRRFGDAAMATGHCERVLTLATAQLPGGDASPERLAASSIWRQLLVSRARDAVGGVLMLSPAASDRDDLPGLFARLREVATGSGVQLQLCGLSYHRVESKELVQRDLRTFLPIGTAVSAVLLFWLIPGFVLALQALCIVPLTLLSTLAVMVATGAQLTMLTSALPTLLMCMSVADGVHMVLRFGEERRAGHAPGDAAARTFAALFWPCLLTSATTVIGFLGLVAADLEDLCELGWFAALGMAFAWLLTMVCLPAAMSLVRRVPPVRRDAAAWITGLALRALAVPRRWLLVPAAAVGAVGLFLGTRVEPDHRMTADLWDDSAVLTQMRAYERRFVNVMPVEIVVRSEHGFAAGAANQQLRELVRRLERREGIARTLSVVDLWQDGVAPALVPGLQRFGLLPSGLLSADGNTARILAFRADLGSAEWRSFVAQLDGWRPDFPALEVRAAGLQAIGAAQVDRLVRDLLASFFVSALVVLLLVWAQCRGLLLGVAAMAPALLTLLGVLATMSLCGITLRPLTVIAFCVAFGLIVDDSIHLVARYREERQAGRDRDAALRAAVTAAGQPVTVTTLLLLGGFATILASAFKGTFSFGLLVCLALLYALATSLLLLPAVLRRGRGGAVQAPPGPP